VVFNLSLVLPSIAKLLLQNLLYYLLEGKGHLPCSPATHHSEINVILGCGLHGDGLNDDSLGYVLAAQTAVDPPA
jgi:hypothetical protein